MDERKSYLNTDELQADDEVSPQPLPDDKDGNRARPSSDVTPDGTGEATPARRPATSE
jgi:hypothetical protein